MYLHSDILYEPKCLTSLLVHPDEAPVVLLIDPLASLDDESMKINLAPSGRINRVSKTIQTSEGVGEWLGIARFSSHSIESLLNVVSKLVTEKNRQWDYETETFNLMIRQGLTVEAAWLSGQSWIEIDTLTDYEKARRIWQ